MAEPAPEEIAMAEAALDRAVVELCRLMGADPDDVRRGLAEAIERDTARIQAQLVGLDPTRVSVVANAIGWEMFHHDHPTVGVVRVGGLTRTKPGENPTVLVTAAETARCEAAARRVLEHLATLDDPLPDRLRPLLDALTDDSPCRFDHHGYCQEHGAGEVDGECANAVARRLLGHDPVTPDPEDRDPMTWA